MYLSLLCKTPIALVNLVGYSNLDISVNFDS